MNNKLSELKSAALAATPGPWLITDENTPWNIEDATGQQVAISQQRTNTRQNPKQTDRTANAIFIAAANPAVVLALLAELEAKDKRILELDYLRLSACEVFKEIGNELGCNPDNESIMMAIDDLKATQMTGPLKDVLKRNIELEAKLATPVRLQSPWEDNVGNRWLLEGTTADAIRAAGFKCVGDE